MNNYLIYGLIDPLTSQIRYVGKSCKGLSRPMEHFTSFRLKEKSKKNSWIKGLLKQGLKPKIIILKICENKEELSEQEVLFIKKYKENLTNMTTGGTGGNTGASIKRRKVIFAKNLITGEERKYDYIWQTVKDNFSPTKVVAVCKGKRLSHKGFLFKYVNENYREYSPKTFRGLRVFDKKTKKTYEFKSFKETMNALGICYLTIRNSLKRKVNETRYKFNYL